MAEEPLIGLLADVWGTLRDLGATFSTAQWDLPTDCPGWTVRDNYSHMIGTEYMLLGVPAEQTEHDVRALPHVRNDIGAFNEIWVENRRNRSGAEVLAEFADVTDRRLAALRALTSEEWDKEGFTPEGQAPYRSFMAIRVFDCWLHEQDVREAVGVTGGLTGAVADLALARIPKGLPFVVGKRAGALQGATVVFSVTGPGDPITVAVAVDGRAAVVDTVPDSPSVLLTMDRRAYNRLAGGRWSGADALARGDVGVEGDTALGRAVVENMGFTI